MYKIAQDTDQSRPKDEDWQSPAAGYSSRSANTGEGDDAQDPNHAEDLFSSLRTHSFSNTNKFQDLITRNGDFTSWLRIDNTRIDYPVVLGSDNHYYLDHNFDRVSSESGSVFMDYRNTGTFMDKHTILYGHHMKNGTMFADLERYLNKEFYEQNRTFMIDTPHETVEYKVFAVHVSKADSFFIQTRFDRDSFADFLSEIRSGSKYDWDTMVDFDDSILTLVTCEYDFDDARIFVHAIRVSP